MSDHEDGPPNEPSSVPPLPTMPAPPSDTEPPPDLITALANDILAEFKKLRDEQALRDANLELRLGALETKLDLIERTADTARAASRVAAQASERARVATDGVAFILKEQTNEGLAEIDRKVEKLGRGVDAVTALHEEQIESLFEQHTDHAALPTDSVQGIYLNGSNR